MSASVASPLLTYKFSDFLEILRSRGLHEKAELYKTVLDVECFIQNIDNGMNLTVDEAISIIENQEDPVMPPTPAGWNSFTWGKIVRE